MSNLFNKLLKALEDTETEAPSWVNKKTSNLIGGSETSTEIPDAPMVDNSATSSAMPDGTVVDNATSAMPNVQMGGSETSTNMPDGTVVDSATSSVMPGVMESTANVEAGLNTTTTVTESSQVGGLNKLLQLLDVTETEDNKVTETEELENQLKNLLEQSGGRKIKRSSKRASKKSSKRSSRGSKKSYSGRAMPPAVLAFNKLSVVVVEKLGVKAGVPSKRAAKIVKDHIASRPENADKTSVEITEMAIKELEVGKDLEKYKKMVANV
jgi:ribosomal protein L22